MGYDLDLMNLTCAKLTFLLKWFYIICGSSIDHECKLNEIIRNENFHRYFHTF